MTKQELAQRHAELTEMFRQVMEAKTKPSSLLPFWHWVKPHLIPFMLGMFFGMLLVPILKPYTPFGQQAPPSIEQQSAQGGAASPFPQWVPPNANHLPTPSTWQPGDLPMESTGESSMNPSEPPLLPNPQVDIGQVPSVPSSRTQMRRR